jgi:hypothetical protein
VQLARQAAEGLLDLGFTGGAVDAQHLVVVAWQPREQSRGARRRARWLSARGASAAEGRHRRWRSRPSFCYH